MKKTLLIAGLFLAGMSATFAQVNYGVKAGVNFANVSVSEDTEGQDPSILTGFNAGVFVNTEVAENLSIQPELFYSSVGSVLAEDGDATWKQKMSYLSLPVLARYQFFEGFRIELGPQVGLLLSSKWEVEGAGDQNGEQDVKDETESIDFGLTGGASYQLPVGVGIFARYYTGLSDITKNDETDITIKNNNISVGLTYTF